MKLSHYLICFVLIFVGIFSCSELFKMFNLKSAEYGNVVTIETKNDYIEVSKFDYGLLSFDSEDYITFTNISTYAPTEFDGRNNDYTILLNDCPVNNVVVSAGKISGEFLKNFYDNNGDLITTSTMSILVDYSESETEVSLSIENVDDSVSYLMSYINIHGVVIKVVQRG